MTTVDGPTRPDPRREQQPDLIGYLAASISLGALVIAGAVFWGAMHDELSPARNLIRFILFAGAAAIAAGLLMFRASRRSRWRNVALVAAFVLAVAGVTTLPPSAAIEVQDHEGALTQAAQQVISTPPSTRDGCAPAAPGLSAGSLGPFEQVCVTISAPAVGVEFRRSRPDGGTEGLIYSANSDAPAPPDTCVRPLFGHWTQFSRPESVECPTGFDFIGGG